MRGAILAALVLAGCSDPAAPVFPADYAGSYGEVRGCRASSDHDLNKIRVLADPAAMGPYLARDVDFPAGAVVLKEEYDFSDADCTGPIVQWTVMRRDAGGPQGWRWQRVDADRDVVSEDEGRCTTCHATCGVPPDGYLGTCTVP